MNGFKCQNAISMLVIAATMTGLCSALPAKPLLRGVTIRNWPYADRLNDRYEGFVVDLMNLIGNQVGFEHRFYFAPDGKYGTEYNGNINGMLGEVYRNRADFAIADITVTESRKKFVDFTEPFMETQLAAIIRREDAAGLRTLEDLVNLNELTRATGGFRGRRASKMIAYGAYRTGSTFYHLSKNRDPVATRMFNWMLRNPQALVTSAKEGFERVNAGRYAFIVESTFADYLSGLYCNLTTLYDTRSLYPRRFAIALPKGSPYLEPFNEAIRNLKASGEIEKLRKFYWSNRCAPLPDVSRNINAKDSVVNNNSQPQNNNNNNNNNNSNANNRQNNDIAPAVDNNSVAETVSVVTKSVQPTEVRVQPEHVPRAKPTMIVEASNNADDRRRGNTVVNINPAPTVTTYPAYHKPMDPSKIYHHNVRIQMGAHQHRRKTQYNPQYDIATYSPDYANRLYRERQHFKYNSASTHQLMPLLTIAFVLANALWRLFSPTSRF